MKKRDLLLILIMLTVSLLGMIPALNSGSGRAYVYADGKLYGTYDLSEPQDIELVSRDGIINRIRIENGYAYMNYATCPGRQCMAGRISKNGETICCAPAKVLVVIRSEDDTEYDAVTE
ncbi:MAG: NusG domain II-containing protein [Lachnospiraceae bacterium]|nr:NusG domain II-containing protein [Lachnospiraceae bacterium]